MKKMDYIKQIIWHNKQTMEKVVNGLSISEGEYYYEKTYGK